MKKLFLLLALLTGGVTAQAGDYSFLTFETTDGAKVSVSISSLNITLSGNTLTAGDQTFTLVNLSKMYFSATDETTGIQSLTTTDWDEVTEMYDMNGRKVSKDQARKGFYIVKSKKGTFKITVK